MLGIALAVALSALVSVENATAAPPIDDDAAAIEAGHVARCENGTYSDNTDFGATCSSSGGVDAWLAPFGACTDGTVIAMSEDASCDGHDGFGMLLPSDFRPEPSADDVARCENGTYSDNTDFGATCSSSGGVDAWLAPFGACTDGTVIAMSEDASCDGHDGFGMLLPTDFIPMPRPGDVARCANGTHSDNTDFEHTCSANGGVDLWLAPTGACTDGAALPMSAETDCGDHGGFSHLNLLNVGTCADGTTSTYLYFPHTCADAGGVAQWLGTSILCQDGTAIALDEHASCDEHAGIVAILTSEVQTSPTVVPAAATTTTTTTSLAPTTTAPTTTLATTVPASTVETTVLPTTTTLAPQIGDPVLPHVSPETFEYHHLDECLVFELNGDHVPTWYRCTATDLEYAVEGEVGVLYITESSDQLAAYEWAQNDPDFTEESSVLTEIVGGGIIYMPDSWIWISDDPEYWDHFNAIDSDCPPFPETYPGTC